MSDNEIELQAFRWKALKDTVKGIMNEPRYPYNSPAVGALQRVLNAMYTLEEEMPAKSIEVMQEENQLWFKRWNTLKNYLDSEYRAEGHNDCCYGTLRNAKGAMDSIGRMNEDAKI